MARWAALAQIGSHRAKTMLALMRFYFDYQDSPAPS